MMLACQPQRAQIRLRTNTDIGAIAAASIRTMAVGGLAASRQNTYHRPVEHALTDWPNRDLGVRSPTSLVWSEAGGEERHVCGLVRDRS